MVYDIHNALGCVMRQCSRTS